MNQRLALLVALVTSVVQGYDMPPIPTDTTTPIHQRIGYLSPTSMSVAWNTYDYIENPCIFYGTDDFSQMACSYQSVRYKTSRNWFNTVNVTGLEPDTLYYYQIYSSNSTPAYFKTARNPGDTTPFTISSVADLGVYGKDGFTKKYPPPKRSLFEKLTWQKRQQPRPVEPSLTHTTIDQLVQDAAKYDFVLHPGDFGYADDYYLNFYPSNVFDEKDSYEAILETFYDQLSYISAFKPYMVGPGNHEAACTEVFYHKGSCPEGQYNFTDFRARFGPNMPTAFDSSSQNAAAKANNTLAKQLANPPFWYSFEYGMVHFVMYNSETDFKDAPDEKNLGAGPFGCPNQQLEFLKADLASVDRNVTPWLVVAGHRPWYTASTSIFTTDRCTECQEAFEDLFYHYGVDLAIFGHVHNSQRNAPTYKNKVDPAGLKNPKAPLSIITGGAGSIEGIDYAVIRHPYTEFAYTDGLAFGTVSFQDKNNLKVEFIRSYDGAVLDSATLYKEHNEQFVRQ